MMQPQKDSDSPEISPVILQRETGRAVVGFTQGSEREEPAADGFLPGTLEAGACIPLKSQLDVC